MRQNWTSTGARHRRKSVHLKGESVIDIGASYIPEQENDQAVHNNDFDGDDVQIDNVGTHPCHAFR